MVVVVGCEDAGIRWMRDALGSSVAAQCEVIQAAKANYLQQTFISTDKNNLQADAVVRPRTTIQISCFILSRSNIFTFWRIQKIKFRLFGDCRFRAYYLNWMNIRTSELWKADHCDGSDLDLVRDECSQRWIRVKIYKRWHSKWYSLELNSLNNAESHQWGCHRSAFWLNI